MVLEPVVILLAGAPGTGKSTIANLLVQRLGLSHHLSTGFIRASIRQFLPDSQVKLMARHAFDAWEELPKPLDTAIDPVLQGLMAQAEVLKPAIKECVGRANREGIGLVVEGSHLIPQIFDPGELGATLLCVLDVPDRKLLQKRALSDNHSRRTLNHTQLDRLLALQETIVGQAKDFGRPVVMNNRLPDAIRQIRALVKQVRPFPSNTKV